MGAAIVSEWAILLVDDEPEVLESFELTLNYEGFGNVVSCPDSRNLLPFLSRNSVVDAIVLDLTMPFISGLELLPHLVEKYPDIPVIVVTATNELEIAVACMKAGAFDYLVKPVEKMALVGSVRRAIEKRSLTRENVALKKHLMGGELEHPECFENIITRNSRMINLFRYCEAIGHSTEPVLITGETGVGKELIARSIHSLSGRKGAFIGVNIAGLDESAFTDSIFGHTKGAFTGADSRREGLIKKASGGTLFLDEIGDLALPQQVKLLRLLQEREYFALGSDVPEKSDARVVTATNRNLAVEGATSFRRDLFYRLQTHHLHIPPLRDRFEDLPLLVESFIEKSSIRLNKPVPLYPEELISLLGCYRFPGNVRELETMIFDAIGQLDAKKLSLDIFRQKIFKGWAKGGNEDRSEGSCLDIPVENPLFSDFLDLPTIEKASIHLIREAMKRSGGNQTIASRILGITQSALSQRLKKMKDKR